jgi:hypothetical protein
MSKFADITTQELEKASEKLILEVTTLRKVVMEKLDALETKSYELNDILIELEERNAKDKSNNG